MTTQIKNIANRLMKNTSSGLQAGTKFNHNTTSTLNQYVESIVGEPVDLRITIEDFKTVMVSCSMEDILEIVRSWCSYYNSRENEKYIMICNLTDDCSVKITIEERGSIGKNLCYKHNGIGMYKLFIRQIQGDGSYHKKAIGYIIEKDSDSGKTVTKLFDCKDKCNAKKQYKLIQKESRQE